MTDLSSYDSQMAVHQVKNITTNHGKTLEYSELLLSDTLRLRLHYNADNNKIELQVEDTNLNIPDFGCTFDRATLKDFITAMKVLYTQLKEEEDGITTVSTTTTTEGA